LTIACTLLVQQLMVIRGEFFFSRIRLEVGVAFPAPAHHRRYGKVKCVVVVGGEAVQERSE